MADICKDKLDADPWPVIHASLSNRLGSSVPSNAVDGMQLGNSLH